MVVEDEGVIAMDLEDHLSEAGFKVTGPFATCAEAISSLGQSLPNVALFDATLKDGPCLDLAREVIRCGVAFVMYSGRDEHQASAPEFHGVTWIEKPAPMKQVLDAVREAVRWQAT